MSVAEKLSNFRADTGTDLTLSFHFHDLFSIRIRTLSIASRGAIAVEKNARGSRNVFTSEKISVFRNKTSCYEQVGRLGEPTCFVLLSLRESGKNYASENQGEHKCVVVRLSVCFSNSNCSNWNLVADPQDRTKNVLSCLMMTARQVDEGFQV